MVVNQDIIIDLSIFHQDANVVYSVLIRMGSRRAVSQSNGEGTLLRGGHEERMGL